MNPTIRLQKMISFLNLLGSILYAIAWIGKGILALCFYQQEDQSFFAYPKI